MKTTTTTTLAKTIKGKSDTSRILEGMTTRSGQPMSVIYPMFLSYWLDVEKMMTDCAGYATYVENFGSFIIYTKGVAKQARLLEKMIYKQLSFQEHYRKVGAPKKLHNTQERIAELLTRIVLLHCSAKQYTHEVVGQYPKKYKVNHKHLATVVGRLEQVFGVPIDRFPVTIRNPLQKIYVQKMRKKGFLPNPVREPKKEG